MKPIVFYYSRSGHTENLARLIATQMRAEIIRIDPEIEYGSFRESLSRLFRERMGKSTCRPMTPIPDIREYDPVFVGFPIWGNDIPIFMKSFLRACDLRGKTLIPFATFAVSGISRALESLEEIAPESKIVLPFEDGVISGGKYKDWRIEIRRYMRTMDE